MRNSECGIKKSVFSTQFGWAGVAVSDTGITRTVLPKKNRRVVERELNSVECEVRRLAPAFTSGTASLAPSDFECASARAGRAGCAESPLTTALSANGRGGRRTLPSEILKKAVRLLRKYFSGKPVVFDLPLDFRNYTPFQQSVWKAAADIPFGETRSYGWIARRIGKNPAARAVGQAMGANPVPVIIP